MNLFLKFIGYKEVEDDTDVILTILSETLFNTISDLELEKKRIRLLERGY